MPSCFGTRRVERGGARVHRLFFSRPLFLRSEKGWKWDIRCSPLCPRMSMGCGSEVERGLERFTLLASSVGLFDGWLGHLTSSQWSPVMREAWLKKGDWPRWSGEALLPCFLPLKPRAVLVWHALSDVEGGGLLADGQTWCSLTTRGSAVSACAF